MINFLSNKSCYVPPLKIPCINPGKPFYGCQQRAYKYYGLVTLGLQLGLGLGSGLGLGLGLGLGSV